MRSLSAWLELQTSRTWTALYLLRQSDCLPLHAFLLQSGCSSVAICNIASAICCNFTFHLKKAVSCEGPWCSCSLGQPAEHFFHLQRLNCHAKSCADRWSIQVGTKLRSFSLELGSSWWPIVVSRAGNSQSISRKACSSMFKKETSLVRETEGAVISKPWHCGQFRVFLQMILSFFL